MPFFNISAMKQDETEATNSETTYCPFKAPLRSVASSEGHEIELKRFEQRPGMSFVRATISGESIKRFSWPARSFLQIAFISFGAIQIAQAEQEPLHCQEGDWLLIKPASSPLTFTANGGSKLHWLGFDKQASAGLTGFSDTLSPRLIDSSSHHLSVHQTNGRLLTLGKELSALEGNDTRERLRIEAKTLEWLALILDQPIFSPCRAVAHAPDAREAKALEAVAKLLESKYSEDHSISSISRTVHLNEFKLKRGFKEQYGTTVFGYLRQVRMEKAREILRGGATSVIEAANAVGYSNPSHFARAFKQAFGINPSEAIAS